LFFHHHRVYPVKPHLHSPGLASRFCPPGSTVLNRCKAVAKYRNTPW
jgi:hypothetical protein